MGGCLGKKKGGEDGEGEQSATDSMKAAVFEVRPRRQPNPYVIWWRALGYLLPDLANPI